MICQAKTNFMTKSILISSLIGIIQNIAFVSSVLSIVLSNNIADPLLITLILSLKRLSRIFLDIPAGFIADKLGTKFIFAISMLAICGSSALLFITSPSIIILLASILLKALSDSCSIGKIEAYIYNNLKQNVQINKFGKTISIYYFSMDLTISIFTWLIGSYLININQILICNIIIACIGCIIVFFMPHQQIFFDKTLKFSSTLNNIKNLLFGDKSILAVMLLWGLCTFLGWQLHSISSLAMTKLNYSVSQIIKIQSLEHFMLCLGCIISIFFCDKMSFKKIWIIFILNMVGMFIAALFYKPVIILASILLYLSSFCILEVFFEKLIDKISPNQVRMSVNSVATTLTIIYSILGTNIFGFLTKYYGFKLAWIILCGLFAIYTISIGIYLIKTKKM